MDSDPEEDSINNPSIVSGELNLTQYAEINFHRTCGLRWNLDAVLAVRLDREKVR